MLVVSTQQSGTFYANDKVLHVLKDLAMQDSIVCCCNRSDSICIIGCLTVFLSLRNHRYICLEGSVWKGKGGEDIKCIKGM